MNPDVQIVGAEQIIAALKNLPQSVNKQVLRKIGRDALDPLAKDAANRAPMDTGKLAASIAISESRTRRARRARALNGGTASGGQYVQIAMGPGAGLGALYYAWWVEFGTSDTPAQPFLRPAWDAGIGTAQQFIADNLWDRISAAAAKEAKKAAADARWFARHKRG